MMSPKNLKLFTNVLRCIRRILRVIINLVTQIHSCEFQQGDNDVEGSSKHPKEGSE